MGFRVFAGDVLIDFFFDAYWCGVFYELRVIVAVAREGEFIRKLADWVEALEGFIVWRHEMAVVSDDDSDDERMKEWKILF